MIKIFLVNGFLFLFLGLLCGSFCLCACLCFCFVVISCISWYFVFRCCFLLLALFCRLILFVCVVFSLTLSLPRLTCSLLYCDWVWLADGRFFGGWGVGGWGQAQCQKRIVRFTSACGARACFGLRRTKAAEISRQAQQHKGWRKLAQEGKSITDFFWQAAKISWHAQHRGRLKFAQEGKRIADFPGRQQRFRGRHSTEDGASWLKKEKNADFVVGTAKSLKVAKSCLVLVFECMRVRRCMRTSAQGSESGQ